MQNNPMSYFYKSLVKTTPVKKRKIVDKTAKEIEETSDCSSSEEEDLDHIYKEIEDLENYKQPIDYWIVTSASRHLRFGAKRTPQYMNIFWSLIVMHGCDYNDEIMYNCLRENRVIEIALNILDSGHVRLQTASLRFLKKLASVQQNHKMAAMLRYKIVDLGGIQSLVALLEEPQIDLRTEAVKTISSLAVFHKAWKIVRLCKGIPLLSTMIFLPKRLLAEKEEGLDPYLSEVLLGALTAGKALYAVCECRKNQKEFFLCGALEGCQIILKSPHTSLKTIIIKLIQRCAAQSYVREAIGRLKILKDLQQHFYSGDQQLLRAAAEAAFICAEKSEMNEFFQQPDFVVKIFELIQTPTFHKDEKLMMSLSGALWHCAGSVTNVLKLQKLNAMPSLIQLLSSQTPDVQANLAACLSFCLAQPQSRTTIRKNGGIEMIVSLLRTTHSKLTMYLCKAAAVATEDKECMMILEKLNILRILWSKLQNDDPSVVSNAAWQLTVIAPKVADLALQIRHFSRGVPIIIELLSSENTRVLTPVCALITVISKERETLKTLTKFNVVESLSAHTETKCKRLRYHLCLAIAACCLHKGNRESFSDCGIVRHLIKMLESNTIEVSEAATRALYQISYIPQLCALMYNIPGVYEILQERMDSVNEEVTISVCGLLRNMRLFTLNRGDYLPEWLIERHIKYKL